MATNPSGAVVSQGLTEYAFGIAQDFKALDQDAEFLAPTVATGAAAGDFATFETSNAFVTYETQRAVGGDRRRMLFASGSDTYNVVPHGLEIGLDDHEVSLARGNRALIEQAKVRALLSAWSLSRFQRTFTVATTSGNYTAPTDGNAGAWSNANIDPIDKIDGVIQQIYEASGQLPNRIGMDFGSWRKLRNHPKVIARQPGSANIGVTQNQLQGMLAAPVESRLFTAVKGTYGFANATTTKTAVASGKCLVWYASASPTAYDPSAIKTFRVTQNGWSNVMTYRNPNQTGDLFYLDSEEVVKKISALLLVVISIT